MGLARESSADGAQLRRRLGAIAATLVVACGFLLAIGLGVLVLAFLGGVAVSVAAFALVAVWPQVRTRLGGWIGALRSHGRGVPVFLGLRWHKARSSSAAALASAHSRTSALARTTSASNSRAARDLAQAARSAAARVGGRPRPDPLRETLHLNAAGTQHRRNGRYDEAVECHRQALELLRTLGDRRAVALTQSNLALALSHSGDDEWAIGLFEEAAATLRELGDEEHEAQIMANLGLAHRRHGRTEEGDDVLELALAKLNPTSTAYHAIEARLRRAS